MISIIIVNFHLSREVLACLDSLEKHIAADRLRVIVVDNDSSDGDLPTLRARVEDNPGWRFIGLPENVGFGAACNHGARASDADWLCFLNPDTTASGDFLSCLESAARATDASLVGPGYGPPRWLEWNSGRFPGCLLEALSIVLLGRPLEALWMGLRRRLGRERPLAVDWVLGACMLIRRRRFESLGGFDESFFLYFEEMDLCRRIRNDGGKVVFAPSCRIAHTGSVSGRRDYRAFTRRFFEGKLHYLHKHHTGSKGILLRGLVRLQLYAQGVAWRLPPLAGSARAAGKREGIADVLAMLDDGFPWESRR